MFRSAQPAPQPRRALDVYDDRRATPHSAAPVQSATAPPPTPDTAAPPALDAALQGLFDAVGRDALAALDTVSAALGARAAAAAADFARGLPDAAADGFFGSAGRGTPALPAGGVPEIPSGGSAYSRYEFRSASRAVGPDGRVTERVVETTRVGDEEPVTRTVTREPGGAEVVTVTRGARPLEGGEWTAALGWEEGEVEAEGGKGGEGYEGGEGSEGGEGGGGVGAAPRRFPAAPFAPAERVREMFERFFARDGRGSA